MTHIEDKFTGQKMVGELISSNDTHSTFRIIKGRKIMVGKVMAFLNVRTEYKNV